MREILYRGKTIKSDKWVQGFYSEITKGGYLNPIQNASQITTFKKLDNGEIILTGLYEIDPTTRGAYTGLKDKNGVKVFEGDILQAHDYPKDSMRFPVTWYDDSACFNLMGLNLKAFVIAGNIHDKEAE